MQAQGLLTSDLRRALHEGDEVALFNAIVIVDIHVINDAPSLGFSEKNLQSRGEVEYLIEGKDEVSVDVDESEDVRQQAALAQRIAGG